jgi:hypothetical protein
MAASPARSQESWFCEATTIEVTVMVISDM